MYLIREYMANRSDYLCMFVDSKEYIRVVGLRMSHDIVQRLIQDIGLSFLDHMRLLTGKVCRTSLVWKNLK